MAEFIIIFFIQATTIAFTAIHPIALLSSIAYAYYVKRSARQGGVALPRDDEHPGLYGSTRGSDRPADHTVADPARLSRTTGLESGAAAVWG